MSTYNKNSPSRGFTIVEVLIIAPIVILMIGIFISAIVSMTGEVLSSRGSNDMAYDIQNAIDKIQQDVKLSGGFLSTNNIVLSTPQGYNDDTTTFDNTSTTASIGDALILNSYATTNNPLDSDRTIMYMSGQPNACNSALLSQNQPVMINIIYFVKDGTLWRRTVMPSNYLTIGCLGGPSGGPWQIPSCVPGYTNSFCKTQDERLVDGIQDEGFSVSYYSSPDSTSPNTTADDPTQSDSIRQSAIQTTNTVGITISASDKVSGRDISQSATMRATSQNDNIFSYSDPVSNGLTVNLDASKTASYPGSGTTWTDLTGNGKNGTLVNGVSYSSSNGGYLLFNGTNNYVSVYSIPDYFWNSRSWTISTWVNFTAVNKGTDNAIIGHGSVALNAGLHLTERSGSAYFGLYGNDLASTRKMTANNWYNIVFTYDNTTKLKKIYINGAFDSSGGTVGYSGTGTNTEIGRIPWGTTSLMSGKIASIRYYYYDLDSSEILQNYNSLRYIYGL